AGAAALVISQRPGITPDQLKALLVKNTRGFHGNTNLKGSGELSLASVLNTSTPSSTQTFTASTGKGSLEQSRGSTHVVDQHGNQLTGERDIFGRGLDTAALAAAEQSPS